MSSGFDSGASPKPYASHADEQTMTCNSGRADERTRIADLLITSLLECVLACPTVSGNCAYLCGFR